MSEPTSRHTARYHPGDAEAAPDGRLFSQVFERNAPPIIAALAPIFENRSGRVLEIGAGTGQHAGAFQLAFPHMDWWPSDPDAIHRASVSAWRDHLRLAAKETLAIDAASDWAPMVQSITPLDCVISLNVIHIAPIEVAKGIANGAGKTLATGGVLIFYGPFMIDGHHKGDGNAAFDAGLRAENPQWGIRDVAEIQEIAKTHGLSLKSKRAMPANNQLLVFEKL